MNKFYKMFEIRMNAKIAECELYRSSETTFGLTVRIEGNSKDYRIESEKTSEALTIAKLQAKMLIMNVCYNYIQEVENI